MDECWLVGWRTTVGWLVGWLVGSSLVGWRVCVLDDRVLSNGLALNDMFYNMIFNSIQKNTSLYNSRLRTAVWSGCLSADYCVASRQSPKKKKKKQDRV